MIKKAIFFLFLLSSLYSAKAQVSFGKATLFNDDWTFVLNQDSSALYKNARSLNLPHDWSIEGKASREYASCQGYLPGGMGWYRKTFTINDNSPLHYVYFEGVYCRSTVYLNGKLLGYRPNGYASFLYDLTPFLKKGTNEIIVKVDHTKQADSRWYTGSGIYRNVWLISSEKTHFKQWGVAWSATDISDTSATLNVSMEVEGAKYVKKNISLKTTLLDDKGNIVASHTSPYDAKKDKQEIQLNIPNPKRWDILSPYLYHLSTEIIEQEKCIDKTECNVGFRSLHFDANEGFSLNGRNIKVKGVCLHHDAGVLGAVVPRDVWKRRLQKLKEMGANAIRMSHNPQDPQLYALCDEMGFLVMDEASDEWEFPKRKWVEGWNVGKPAYEGTYDFFEEWIERDVADMVKRDRNHPSVFLWSIGNEVDYPNDPYSHPILDGKNATINQPMFGGYKKEAPNAERIGKIAKRLSAIVRKIDSSRPVTGALAGVVMSNETEYPEAIDVVGYNYTENRYDTDHELYPQRIIYGSETGVGYQNWKDVRDRNHIFGQFIWTGLDYLGESGRWPSRGLNTGLLDFCADKKPRGWFRASLWSESPITYIGTYPLRNNRNGDNNRRNTLSIEAQDNWNYNDGQTIRVVCYTNSTKARLLLNGSVVGKTKDYDDSTGIIHWDIPYAPGTLLCEGLDKAGNIESQYAIKTTSEVAQLNISADKSSLPNPGDVAHVFIELHDKDGNLVKNADTNISCEVNGGGVLLGLESGNNADMSEAHLNTRRSFHGRLLAYVKRVSKDSITITIKCGELSEQLTIDD